MENLLVKKVNLKYKNIFKNRDKFELTNYIQLIINNIIEKSINSIIFINIQ